MIYLLSVVLFLVVVLLFLTAGGRCRIAGRATGRLLMFGSTAWEGFTPVCGTYSSVPRRLLLSNLNHTYTRTKDRQLRGRRKLVLALE